MLFVEHFEFTPYDIEFVGERERRERTRQHEAAHEWLAVKKGAEVEERLFRPDGVSQVKIRGLKDLRAYYEVGVAGMLAEAIAIQRFSNPGCNLRSDSMGMLGVFLYYRFKDKQADPFSNDFCEPLVPTSCDIPSAGRGHISLCDLVEPISNGMDLNILKDVLKGVSERFNDPNDWADFQGYVDEYYKIV